VTVEKILEVLLFMPGFLFSLSFHEAAHGYVAHLRGDDTAMRAGRVTLNPIPHTDIIGTLVLPIFGLLFGGFLFGWGKPVPVDYRNLKNLKKDAMWVALAGPTSNFILAFAFAGVIHLYIHFLPDLLHYVRQYPLLMILEALKNILILNLALCFFNLIPIEPLDGGKILFGILPTRIGYKVEQFTARYGMIILLILIFTGALRFILWPPIALFANLLLGG
jgi:Zn-dependent protease